MRVRRIALAGSATSATVFAVGTILPWLVGTIERRRPHHGFAPRSSLGASPSIEVIIPAYQEAGVIGATIGSLREALAKYEGPSSITVVASDTATAEAAGRAGATRVLVASRDGKSAATNFGVKNSTAEVVVLTDANCVVIPDEWPTIMLNELERAHLVSANKTEQDGPESAFWWLERRAKQVTSDNVGTLSVAGEFLALRRADFRPIPDSVMCDDLWLAAAIAFDGGHVAVGSQLLTTEIPAFGADQWSRRVRNSQMVLFEQLPLWWPTYLRVPAGRVFLAHKIYRSSIGVGAFWLSVALGAFACPPLTTPLPVVAAFAVARYAGRLGKARPGRITTVIGMQAVPVAAALRFLRGQGLGGDGAGRGWTKPAR